MFFNSFYANIVIIGIDLKNLGCYTLINFWWRDTVCPIHNQIVSFISGEQQTWI